ncbi:MAG TPA: glycosyltransferase 87 family protein, partial [Ktedonobacterales bacterium]|nr:glycosyltransferase 87 family protein [Ktedonobacterales bacterium]
MPNLPNQRTALVLARAAVFGLIVLVLGYAIAGLIAQIGTPLPSFAGSYVAASAAIHVPGAPIYEYGTLLRVNAAHQYITAGFYPFVAPPFALLALAPLTLLPYAAASVFWLAITRLCALGAALALADAFSVVAARRDAAQGLTSRRVLAVLRQTSPQIGAWRFPAAPFALGAALLLLALPPLDAISWDSLSLVAILLVALALDAFVRGHPLLAGFAVALASGFSFLPLVLVACFLIRGAWKAAASAIFFALAVAAAPLLLFPARSYGDLAAALRFAQGVYGSSDHNVSLLGAASTAII